MSSGFFLVKSETGFCIAPGGQPQIPHGDGDDGNVVMALTRLVMEMIMLIMMKMTMKRYCTSTPAANTVLRH